MTSTGHVPRSEFVYSLVIAEESGTIAASGAVLAADGLTQAGPGLTLTDSPRLPTNLGCGSVRCAATVSPVSSPGMWSRRRRARTRRPRWRSCWTHASAATPACTVREDPEG